MGDSFVSGSESLRSDSNKLAGEKRSIAESEDQSESKRIKMRDLDSLLRSEGIESNAKLSLNKENKDQLHFSKNEEASQDTVETADTVSDEYQAVTTRQDSLSILGDAAFLSLGHVGIPSNSTDVSNEADTSNNADCDVQAAAEIDTNGKTSPLTKPQGDQDLGFASSRGIGLDLNAENVDPAADKDPFYPYKAHGYKKSREDSECGSTTGPLEENDSFKMWKEMKRNGFLSSSYGGIPAPKQRGRKKKNDPLKTRMEIAKREQVNRFTKIAAPSGLLNGLNPGIINHVRNSKQVHSIIEALVRSEKRENCHQSKSARRLKTGNKEINEKEKDQINFHNSGAIQASLYHSDGPSTILAGSKERRESLVSSTTCALPISLKQKGGFSDSYSADRRAQNEIYAASQLTSDCENETLTLKLSTTTMMTENTSLSHEESANQASVSSLSVKAATVASQWLELLHQDIKGRLLALKRSKKRVQAVIETELPFLMSKEFSSNQENDPRLSQSSTGALNSANADMHRARWTALFYQMEKSLSEEGNHLESWLNQVKEMQAHCEQGLQCVNLHSFQLAIDPRSKKDNMQRELAVRAAAASIYSTCNYAMAKEDVSCF